MVKKNNSRVLLKSISDLRDEVFLTHLRLQIWNSSKTNPSNYRPIPLLPLISKIIEKVVHEQGSNFLTKNGIL